MLTKEVLHRNENGRWPEPGGEIIEVLNQSRGRLVLLTRIKERPSAPIDPAEYTVGELKEMLSDNGWSDEEIKLLYDAEVSGKGRKTALSAIEEEMP